MGDRTFLPTGLVEPNPTPAERTAAAMQLILMAYAFNTKLVEPTTAAVSRCGAWPRPSSSPRSL
ncbi:hypothetical protein ABTX81_01630 [Kitasatospora sp. NPDC097605]|uniref:hypothetical protein n=1 Tax=Kitasatospora sp. NPDC097605 TaxID=3157226 RepID=UPI003317CDB5